MTKKTIILLLILLIVINTFYWISLIYQLGKVLLFYKHPLLYGFYRFSGENGDYAVKNIIDLLTITDAVLIAISFMIILLYKKDWDKKGRNMVNHKEIKKEEIKEEASELKKEELKISEEVIEEKEEEKVEEKPALDYEKANIFKRFVAFIIDCILASIIAGIIAGIIVVLILNKILTSYSFPFLIAGVYMLLRDGFSPQNRSIGKRVFNLKPIIVETGGNCDFKTSAKRNWPIAIGFFLYSIAMYHYSLFESKWIFADSLGSLWIIFIIIEAVLIFTDKKGVRIGDKMAGTQVIELKKLKMKKKK